MTAGSPCCFAGSTGRGVRVAVVDSGIHGGHPHVGGVSGGIGLVTPGAECGDYVDRLGHGTAVAAAIRDVAPGVDLLAVKIFEDRLSADTDTLVRAIDWASGHDASVINLSLGTARQDAAAALGAAVERAVRCGAIVVAAGEQGGTRWLPGSLAGVLPVVVDWECPRSEYRVTPSPAGMLFRASGYPRDIPGVPRERNLKGISFAVANMSGFVARSLESSPVRSLEEVVRALVEQA